MPGRTDVKPVHSSVKEVVERELRRDREFLSSVAIRLSRVEQVAAIMIHEHQEKTQAEQNLEVEQTPQSELHVSLANQEIYLYLLSFVPVFSLEAATKLADLMPWVVKENGMMFRSYLPSRILSSWKELPDVMRQAFLQLLQLGDSKHPLSAGEILGYLASHREFSVEEAWPFYDLMLLQGEVGVNGLMYNSAWEFLLQHIDEAPLRLRAVFDIAARVPDISGATSRVAESAPDPLRSQLKNLAPDVPRLRRLCAYMLGSLFGRYWDTMPTEWRELALSDESRYSETVQQQIYWGMHWPLRAQSCPGPLVLMLREQLQHPQWKLRALAATFNIIFHEFVPQENLKALEDLYRTERDLRVFRYIWKEAGDGEERFTKLDFILDARLKAQDPPFDPATLQSLDHNDESTRC